MSSFQVLATAIAAQVGTGNIVALGFTGCMVQSNSTGECFNTAFGIPTRIVGIVLVLICGFIFLGTLTSNDLVWELSDMFNNLMVIPNAIALFALTAMVRKTTKGLKK